MRVLVCGGRDYTDWRHVFAELDAIHNSDIGPITLIIEGGATGADRFAAGWALDNRVRSMRYVADWKRHGKRAGPVRNAQMLSKGKPDLVMAFPGGSGTADMAAKAEAADITVLHFATRSHRI